MTDAATLAHDARALRRHQIRAVVSASVGTTIEWYDFFLYGVAAATVFPQKFFPSSDPFIATMLSFTTFFVGFVARPVGAAIFGHFGDRVGRKKLLVFTMIVMGASTMAVGLTPGYGPALRAMTGNPRICARSGSARGFQKSICAFG